MLIKIQSLRLKITIEIVTINVYDSFSSLFKEVEK